MLLPVSCREKVVTIKNPFPGEGDGKIIITPSVDHVQLVSDETSKLPMLETRHLQPR